MTTAEKLADLDAWTISGVIPTSIQISGAAIANAVAWSEFNALTAQQQDNLLGLFQIDGLLLGGSTNVSLLSDGMMISYFSSTTTTRANLTALAQAQVTPWWQANGYTSPISLTDLSLVGLS